MTTLNYDANGFIVGINRMKDGIDNVHDDTQEIVQILKSQNQIGNTRMRELTRAVKSANYRSESQASASISRTRSSSLDRRPRISSSASTDGTNNRNSNRSSSGSASRSTISRASSSAADRSINSSGSSNRSTSSSDSSPGNTRRERDANGRFVSDGSNSKRGFGLPGGGMGGLGNDVSGMDPVLDSLKEAKDLLSPIGRAGKLAGRATKFSWSKFKSMKRREPLSNDETRHNRENEKLLDKIWKAIKKQGGGGGGGLLDGLLGAGGGRNRRNRRNRRRGRGGLFRRGLGFLGKKLPYIGAAVGAGALAMDWGGLNHKEKSAGVGGLAGTTAGMAAGGAAGATIGSIVPVVGTVIGGLIGAGIGGWIGSGAGEALGAAASPYIEDWTNSITAYNLPKKMGDTWNDGVKPFFSKILKTAGDFRSWVKDLPAGIKDFFGFDGDDSDDGGNSVWTGETANLKGTSAKAVHTASQYKAGNIGGLDDAMTRRLVASTVQTESAGGNPSLVNSGGYLGRYQAGAAWLADAGMIRGGADSVKSAKQRDGYGGKSDWAWASSGGMTKFLKDSRNWTEGMSREKYLSSPEIQDKAFQKATSKSYDQLKRMGAITSNTSQTEVAGLLKAAHLGGAGNANKVAKGGVGATDANGTSTRKYYNDIVKNKDGLNAALRDKTIIDNIKDVPVKDVVKQKQPASKEVKGSVASKAKNNSSALGVNLGGMTPDKSKGISSNFSDNKPMIFNSSTPSGSNAGYAPANMPASPVLKIPAAPKIKERLDSGGSNKPVMLQSSNDTINQNLSDRGLAHAVTGGFGQDRMWG